MVLPPATVYRLLPAPIITSPVASKLERQRRHSAEKETPSSRRRASWTPEQVTGYFSGYTDAASHLAENAANNYLNSGQPITPLQRVPPVKPPRLQVRSSPQQVPISRQQSSRKLFSVTDPSFLDSPNEIVTMGVRRCSLCHLFIEGAPTPDLVHVGQFGPSCVAPHHHPDPCDYQTREGIPCNQFGNLDSNESGDVLEGKLTPAQLQARDKTRQLELDKMAAEMVSLRKQQVDMDKISSEMYEMKQLLMSLRPSPQQGSTLASSTSQEVSQSSPVVSAVVSVQDQQLLGAVGGSVQPSSLHQDVASHIQNNTIPPASTQPRGIYTGPTMTELRKDDTLNLVTQQVLAVLEMRIPQIRETFATPHLAATTPHASLVTSSFHMSTPMTTATTVTSAFTSRPVASTIPFSSPSQDLGADHPAYQALLSGHTLPVQPGSASARRPQLPGERPHSEDFMDAASIMQLCTVSNRRELRPHEFVRLGRFSYASKITDKNITVPLFVMGYLQYVVAILKGVAPRQSETEIVDRLNNLMTVMEITSNNSTLEDFKSPGWSIGLEYASRIFHDIEYGRLKWEDLSEGLQAHTFLYAKDTVEMQGKLGKGRGAVSDQPRGRGGGRGRGGKGRGGVGDKSDGYQEGIKVCQSYNGFWTGNVCAYEYTNNRKCSYEHYCSTCFDKSGTKENHKAYYCQVDGKSATSGSGAAKPAVTSG